MRAGALNRRIQVRDKGTITKSDYGSEVISWDEVVCSVWAGVRRAGGREGVEAQQGQGFQGWMVRFRHQPLVEILPKMRVHYTVDGALRVLNVEAVDLSLNERRRETVLSCSEILDEE